MTIWARAVTVCDPHTVRHTVFEIFPWTPQLETGIALIDEQHHRLVGMLNRLAQQHAQGTSPEDIQTILGGLADYADYHFKYEESVWQKALSGDDWLGQHVRAHQEFFERITLLNSGTRPFNEVLGDLAGDQTDIGVSLFSALSRRGLGDAAEALRQWVPAPAALA